VVNNGEGRIRQGGNTREGVFLGFWVRFSYEKKEGEQRELEVGSVLLDYWFCLRRLLEDCHRGHLLLGVLGSGARKP
jgi:hypothetical protein